MSQDSAYRPRLIIDGVEALNLVSAKYSTAMNSNISNFNATIDSPDLQESSLFGKNVEESLIAADFKVLKNGNKTDFIFNPLSVLSPGKTRNFFDIWE